MKFLLKIFLTIFMLLQSSFIFAQKLSAEEMEILMLQDKRTIGENENLLNYLDSDDFQIKQNAICALANIADSTSVFKSSQILSALFIENNTSALLNEYAFFLGQTVCLKSQTILTLMSVSDPKNVYLSYPEIINSFGKTGDETSMNEMIRMFSAKELPVDNSINIYRALAMSLGRFALRKIKNENSVDALKQMANINDSIVQRNIAFAFWRTGDKSLLDTARQEIYTLAESNDAQTRMWAYNAMGKLQDNMLLMFMLESFNSEKDWRVKVNMLNSLTNFKLDSLNDLTKQLYSVLSDAIGNEDEHVSLTAINVLGKLFADINKSNNEAAKSLSETIKKEFIYSIDSVNDISWRQKSELANSMSITFRDEVKDVLFRAYTNTNNYDYKSEIVRAFGNFDDGLIYREVRDTISADVQRYNALNPNTTGDMIGSKDLAKLYRGFVEMLSNLDEKVDDENQNNIRLIFTEFAASKDPLIVDISLSALKDSLYMKYREETSSVLLFDYDELENGKDDDVNLIFIDAMKNLYNGKTSKRLENNLNSENFEIAKSSAEVLETITGKKYDFTAKPRYDFDWEYIEGLSKKEFITVRTNKGNIRIKLLPDVAPFTVMNFLKLAEKNYFDGTFFHRVVSNFVIQGGDPTATGYGGPGYSIRSEFSPLTYERGMVGMASSGKDTEGSQFFITHSATPHLDGKYTIFGEVVEGMEVVDEIMIGDFIETITN